MAKLAVFLTFFWGALASAKGLKLELYAQTTLPASAESSSEQVGGLSALFWDGSYLRAVCDDRGKWGPGRFYELDFKLTPAKGPKEAAAKVEWAVRKPQHFKNIPAGWILDLEGLAPLPNGDLLVSTEGDHNKKPRALPQIFMTSKEGVFKSAISLPDKFLPEPTGLQKKGLENNRGFEGLTVEPNGQSFYVLNEYPIISDQGTKDSELWLRLMEFAKSKETFQAKAEYAYKVSKVESHDKGPELFRGVSELLYHSENKFLVLERGARLSKKGFSYTGALYLVDISGAQDVSNVTKLAEGSTPALKKELLLDFEDVLKNQDVENFEGLAWGPSLPDGRKSLLVLSDNNFSKKEKTMLLVFAVNEVE